MTIGNSFLHRSQSCYIYRTTSDKRGARSDQSGSGRLETDHRRNRSTTQEAKFRRRLSPAPGEAAAAVRYVSAPCAVGAAGGQWSLPEPGAGAAPRHVTCSPSGYTAPAAPCAKPSDRAWGQLCLRRKFRPTDYRAGRDGGRRVLMAPRGVHTGFALNSRPGGRRNRARPCWRLVDTSVFHASLS